MDSSTLSERSSTENLDLSKHAQNANFLCLSIQAVCLKQFWRACGSKIPTNYSNQDLQDIQ